MTTETISGNGTALSLSERQRFGELDSQVEKGINAYCAVGVALREIRDSRLYRESFDTFESYCESKQLGRPSAYRLIVAAEVIEELTDPVLSPIGDKNTPSLHFDTVVDDSTSQLPRTESQVRELGRAPKGERKAAWKKAVASAPKDKKGKPKVTAVQLRKVVEQKEPEKENPVDELGKPLPERADLRACFEQRAVFEDAMNQLSRIKGAMGKLGEKPLAYLRASQFEADLKNIRDALRFSKPYAVCPYCKGTAKRHADCNACKGLGWVSEGIFTGAPKELQAAGGKK